MAERDDAPNALRQRAARFLEREIPAELRPHHVPGSLADVVIARYAQGNSIDPELREIAELAVLEYDSAIAQAKTPELREYYTECQAVLTEILAT